MAVAALTVSPPCLLYALFVAKFLGLLNAEGWTVRSDLSIDFSAESAIASVGGIVYWLKQNTHIAFDGNTNSWDNKDAMGTTRTMWAAHALTTTFMIVVGGYQNEEYVGTCNLYDTSTDSWEEAASLPAVRGEVALAGDSATFVFSIGGASSSTERNRDLWRYTASTDAWVERTSFPYDNFRMGAAYDSGVVVVIGGGVNVDSLHTYTIDSDTWTTGTKSPSPRLDISAAVVADKTFASFFVFGGTNYPENRQFEMYSVPCDAWTTVGTLLPKEHSKGLAGFRISGGSSFILAVGSVGGPPRSVDEFEYTSPYPFPACPAPAPGGASSDPHMRGFFGHRFILETSHSGVFNLFSSSSLQVNILLDKVEDAPTGWGTLITHVGVKAHNNGDELTVLVDSTGKVDTNRLQKDVFYTGDTMQFPCGSVLITAGVGVRVTTHLFSLQIFPQHRTLGNGLVFHYLDVLINPTWPRDYPLHGILGQTASSSVPFPAHSRLLEIRDPFRYLEGNLMNYEVENGDIFGCSTNFCLYDEPTTS